MLACLGERSQLCGADKQRIPMLMARGRLKFLPFSLSPQRTSAADQRRYDNVVVVPGSDTRREAALRALLSCEIAKEAERQGKAASVSPSRMGV